MSAYVSSKRLRDAYHDSMARESQQLDVHGLPGWNPSANFVDADTIIIAFRLLGDPEVDHWASFNSENANTHTNTNTPGKKSVGGARKLSVGGTPGRGTPGRGTPGRGTPATAGGRRRL